MAKHRFYLCASSADAGLTTTSLGTARALDRRGIRVAFCKPISQRPVTEENPDPSTIFAEKFLSIKPPAPIDLTVAEQFIREKKVDDLMEKVVEMIEGLSEKADVLIIEGLLAEESQTFKNRLNRDIAR
ncbi:MAG: AAA family ATPase, partial [Puniceicoccales bacterium]